MRLRVPTNFDDGLLPELARLGVDEVYGKAAADVVGGGKPSFLLPQVGWRDIERHIGLARSLGLDFDYPLNAQCMDNKEYTKSLYGDLVRLIKQLNGYGVNATTVSMPFMLRLVKDTCPHWFVSVSAFALVDNVQALRAWEELGADQITVPEIGIVRDFRMLRALRGSTKLRIQVLGNSGCLLNCAGKFAHSAAISHASQSWHSSGGLHIDYNYITCRKRMLDDPVQVLRSQAWIRPEDVKFYENIGIDSLKLIDRILPSEKLLLFAKAYSEREFNGDLSELLPAFQGPKHDGKGIRPSVKYMLHPTLVNPFKLRIFKDKMVWPTIHIDNRGLDGFIVPFVNETNRCRETTCEECHYCDKWGQKVLTYDREALMEGSRNLGVILRTMESGGLM